MSLHIEFEPHSWYMGFAIKRNTSWPIEDTDAFTYTAYTDDGNTYSIVTLNAYTLERLRRAIRDYHVMKMDGYGERILNRRSMEYLPL